MKLFEFFGRLANPHRYEDELKRKAEEAQRAREQEEAMRHAAREAEKNRLKNKGESKK